MVDSTNNRPDSNTAPQELALDIEGREQFNALLFVQTDANPGDLTVILPDSTPDNPDDNPQIVFPNYIALANAGLPPALTLADGTVIPGEEILALIEGLDYGKVAPAAGQQGGTNSAGGGAGFAAYTTEGLGDDLNHGPYAGGYMGPRVEFGDDQPVYPDDEDGSTPSRFIGPATTYRNDQATWTFDITRDDHTVGGLATVNGADNPAIQDIGGGVGQFTFLANLGSPFPGAADDWDGGQIWLQAGETITLTNQTPGGHYWLAIDDDLNWDFTQPAGQPQIGNFSWDHTLESYTVGDSLSYTATHDGWYYFAAGGVDGITPELGALPSDYDYETLVTIYPPGAYPGADGTGTDVLGGTTGDDVIVSGDGNDTMSGGPGDDTFVYNSIDDGRDTIRDFMNGNDTINLDALFDALGVADGDPARGDVLVDNDAFGNAVLTIGDGTFTHTEDAAAQAAGFEITLDGALGMTDANIAPLIASGNLVVDES